MDTVPYIRAAGFSVPVDANSTASCIQPDTDAANHKQQTQQPQQQAAAFSPSASPYDSTYRYRADFKTQPSLRLIHPGLVSASPPSEPEVAHGVTSKQSLTAADVLLSSSSFTPSPLAAHLQTQKEAQYQSNILHPLGRSYTRGHELPAVTSQPDFRFGRSSRKSDDAKTLIYAATAAPKSASSSSSGEEEKQQLDLSDFYSRDRKSSSKSLSRQEEEEITQPAHRDYSWPQNPELQTFGHPRPAKTAADGHQVRQALSFDSDEQQTQLVQARVTEHARLTKHSVGRVKDITTAVVQSQHVDAKHRFGQPTRKDALDAKAVIRGDYSEAEQQPDADLGRTRTSKSTPALDNSTVFGMPSRRSEGNSKQLLYPAAFAAYGLDDSHFLQSRSSDEIRRIFVSVGLQFKEAQWAVLCSSAERLYGVLSVDSVRHAINRQQLEKCCPVCGAIQCQHADCAERACQHDGMDGLGNHRSFMTHDRKVAPLNRPKGATGAGYTPLLRAGSQALN